MTTTLRFRLAVILALGSFCLNYPLLAQSTDSADVALADTGKTADVTTSSWLGAEITMISTDFGSMQATRNDTIWTFATVAPEVKKIVGTFAVGDRVNLTYSLDADQKTLVNLVAETHKISKSKRIWTLLCTAVGVLILSRLLLQQKLRKLILGIDNRYSNSNFQIVIWFFTLIVTYIAVTILRSTISLDFVGGVDIPANLLLLSGLSALTFAAAKGITQSKEQQAIKLNQDRKLTALEPHFPRDLFQNDMEKVDMADFQMIIITLLAVGVYAFEVYNFLGTIELRNNVMLPDVDSTILATFGLGHGAYLAKKYVGDINS